MHHVQRQFTDRRVKFLVCGNGELRLRDFADLNIHVGTRHLIEHMYAFAEVDYLIGPPSTFTEWASLYGDVPLHKIETVGQLPQPMNLEQRAA
jgi:hypothetical protein